MDEKFKKILLKCTGFEWDEGNKDKNWIKHKVSNSECEEIFFNQPLIALGSVPGAVIIYLLEIFIAFIQAYIFTILSALFIGASLHPEH